MMTEAEFLEREQELLKVTPLGEVKDSDLAKLTPSNQLLHANLRERAETRFSA